MCPDLSAATRQVKPLLAAAVLANWWRALIRIVQYSLSDVRRGHLDSLKHLKRHGFVAHQGRGAALGRRAEILREWLRR